MQHNTRTRIPQFAIGAARFSRLQLIGFSEEDGSAAGPKGVRIRDPGESKWQVCSLANRVSVLFCLYVCFCGRGKVFCLVLYVFFCCFVRVFLFCVFVGVHAWRRYECVCACVYVRVCCIRLVDYFQFEVR